MTALLGVDGLHIRWTSGRSAGLMWGESQRPVNPGKGMSLEGQEAGAQVEPSPCHGERGKRVWAQETQTEDQTVGLG